MDTRLSPFHAPLIAMALLALLIALYFSGFYLLGSVGTAGAARLHVYKSPWLALFFAPAAKVESLILGQEVYAAHPVDP